MKKPYIFIPLLLSALFLSSCYMSNPNGFKGDQSAIKKAGEMFLAIGGFDKWCNMKSLYVKATHVEDPLPLPYKSEIWRSMEEFQIVIEQQNDSFHVKAIIDESSGRVNYLDKRDTFRILNDEQLSGWKHSHSHNIYVILHKLACGPSSYTVEIDKDGLLTFSKEEKLYCKFELDDQSRPHIYYHLNFEGNLAGSRFTHWGTDDGLVHSAGGHPLDSSFFYKTQEWIPSNENLQETFGKEVFSLPSAKN